MSRMQELYWRAMEGYEDQLGKSNQEALRVTSELATLLQDCQGVRCQDSRDVNQKVNQITEDLGDCTF